MNHYDPFRPDVPIPPDIFDYIGEFIARIFAFVITFILMGYFGVWLHAMIEPHVTDFVHWLGWLSR